MAAITVTAQSPTPTAMASIQNLYHVSVDKSVNLRAGPGTNHVRLGVAEPGDAFEVVGRQASSPYNWLEIRYENGTAWIAESLTNRLPDPTDTPVPTNTPTPTLTASVRAQEDAEETSCRRLSSGLPLCDGVTITLKPIETPTATATPHPLVAIFEAFYDWLDGLERNSQLIEGFIPEIREFFERIEQLGSSIPAFAPERRIFDQMCAKIAGKAADVMVVWHHRNLLEESADYFFGRKTFDEAARMRVHVEWKQSFESFCR